MFGYFIIRRQIFSCIFDFLFLTSATCEQQQQQQRGGLMLTMTINLNDMPFAAHSVCSNDRHDTALCQLALNLSFHCRAGWGLVCWVTMDFNQTPLWS